MNSKLILLGSLVLVGLILSGCVWYGGYGYDFGYSHGYRYDYDDHRHDGHYRPHQWRDHDRGWRGPGYRPHRR
ncbi:MAG: hypothetical protein FJ115_14670 [Deltaproteobacteria bacterium]|nr:hypothetical protein [Deltaproteobacteria bacterium]